MKLSDKPLVACVWLDAHSSALGDYTESEVARDFHKPAEYVTYGLLLREDESGITIAQDESGAEYRGLSFIPRAMVVSVTHLGVPSKFRPKRKRAPRVPAPPALPEPVASH